ncbi:hypothetical protein G6N82_06120 [Altererythrobacter sp. BO-6]|uniref:hypothetical protein n=1 Tax=Altererythrobacter sp. BO-6 TaxID=2604537 RepID=UPI0013E0FBC0|nr:hypothetical protein [Altererythrobacter sp. BO-6]QIG53787.1 hypothetical protein G6N82_06120 [Altererythrobacter sp. BO-6]
MIIIRTAEELARALASPHECTLRERLEAQRDYLADYLHDYTFEELALLVIVEPRDHLEDLNPASGVRLVRDGTFAFEVEIANRYCDWLELLFVISDDGFGVVLFVPITGDIDPAILAACQDQAPHLEIVPSRQVGEHKPIS